MQTIDFIEFLKLREEIAGLQTLAAPSVLWLPLDVQAGRLVSHRLWYGANRSLP